MRKNARIRLAMNGKKKERDPCLCKNVWYAPVMCRQMTLYEMEYVQCVRAFESLG